MNIIERTSKDGLRTYYALEWGRQQGERLSTGIFTYNKPVNQVQKNHNKTARQLLDIKVSEFTIDMQSIGSAFIPPHKLNSNFLDYYSNYVKKNRKFNNRHLPCSLDHFKKFLGRDFISPIDITENLCEQFRNYLLEKLTGESPANYFLKFKKVLKAATKDRYYKANPAEDVAAKTHRKRKRKENLEAEEYIQLLKTPCRNYTIREAFIFCCYTGLRWCDIESLKWENIINEGSTLHMHQKKTEVAITITLHDIAKELLQKNRKRIVVFNPTEKVYKLPSADGANKILGQWCKDAGIFKHVTWHCARISFSVLLQDQNVDAATVALLLGHTTTKYVLQTYKRHRLKDTQEIIGKLPAI